MKKTLRKRLYRLTEAHIGRLFPEAELKVFDSPPKGWPDPRLTVEEGRRAVATLELFPEEWRCWVLNRDQAVKLFLVLGISPKDDSFTFEIAWSTNGRLPPARMLDPGEEGASTELHFRLGRFWGADGYDQWWYIGQRRTPMDIVAGVPDDPLPVKVADVETKLGEALQRVQH